MTKTLQTAETNDVFERDGKLWRVIGFIRDPAIILHEVGTPNGERNQAVVVQSSPLAKEWTAPTPERVADLLAPFSP